jgi:hypothetical protein
MNMQSLGGMQDRGLDPTWHIMSVFGMETLTRKSMPDAYELMNAASCYAVHGTTQAISHSLSTQHGVVNRITLPHGQELQLPTGISLRQFGQHDLDR